MICIFFSLLAEYLNPASLATEVMNNLCSKEDVCSICLCKDTVTETLMLPITQWLDSYKVSDSLYCLFPLLFWHIVTKLTLKIEKFHHNFLQVNVTWFLAK